MFIKFLLAPNILNTSKEKIFLVITIILFITILEISSYFIISFFSHKGPTDESIDVNSEFDPVKGWTHPPNTLIRSKRNSDISTDENGFSITPIKHKEVDYRIAITGGSSIFGVASSSNEYTVP